MDLTNNAPAGEGRDAAVTPEALEGLVRVRTLLRGAEDADQEEEQAEFQEHLNYVRERAADPRSRVDARKRLMQDLKRLRLCANPAISASPIDGDLFSWRAVVLGPDNTAWEGGLFKLRLTFSDEYPCAPPTVQFVTKNMFHPNVYKDGKICLDTLKTHWSPTLDVETLLVMIASLLSDPNPASAANAEAAHLFLNAKDKYEDRVRRLVEESLEQSFSGEEEEEEEEEEEK